MQTPRRSTFEAVRVVAPVGDGGRGDTDVFFRDNRLDWENTEQPSNLTFEPVRGFIPHWQSVDIKVDAPPYPPDPVTSQDFDAFVHENPEAEADNRVHVRIHNRGRVATDVTVKVHWAFAGTALPALPLDFWAAFPADSTDTTQWNPMPAQTLTGVAYSGASVAGTAADNSQVATFMFTAPALDLTLGNPRHYGLMAVAESAADPVDANSRSTRVVDLVTPNDNNVTHGAVLHPQPVRLPHRDATRDSADPVRRDRARGRRPGGAAGRGLLHPARGSRGARRRGRGAILARRRDPRTAGGAALREKHHHVLFMGPMGVGKTMLAHALGHLAVLQERSVICETADKMLHRLKGR